MEIDKEYRELLERTLKEEAKHEAGVGALIYSWIVKIFTPFNRVFL